MKIAAEALTSVSVHSLSASRYANVREAYTAIAMWREKDGYADRRSAWLQRFATGTLLNIGR